MNRYSFYKAPKKKKARILILILAFLLIFAPLVLFNSKDGKATDFQNYEEVIVEKGDTIWSLAQERRPSGTELRKFVYEIVQLNEIDDSLIYPGERLKIPVKEVL